MNMLNRISVHHIKGSAKDLMPLGEDTEALNQNIDIQGKHGRHPEGNRIVINCNSLGEVMKEPHPFLSF